MFYAQPSTPVRTTLSLHDALPILQMLDLPASKAPFLAQLYDILGGALAGNPRALEQHFDIKRSEGADGWRLMLTPKARSEEHTSELQSQSNIVCRLLLEKKNTPHK